MPNTTSPRSPTSSITPSTSLNPSVPSSSKPKRSVRVFTHLDDSDSEDESRKSRISEGAEETHPPNTRHSSQTSTTSPTARFSPSNIQPRISRSSTSGSTSSRSKASALAAEHASTMDPASARYRELRSKHRAAPNRERNLRAHDNSVDPDAHYFQSSRQPGWDSEEDEITLDLGESEDPLRALSFQQEDSAEGRERIEWQSMLASVLAGDVLQGESSRIGLDRPGDEMFKKRLGQSLWWQIRARMRGRSEDEEKRRVEERRNRVVDTVLEEAESFVVKQSQTGLARRLSSEGKEEDGVSEASALDQVTYILQRLGLVEALYPHQAAFRAAKRLYDSASFQSKIDALTAWSTVVTALQAQLHILQKWTGSDDLDVTRPNTTKEKALVGKNRYHPLDSKGKGQSLNDQAADDTTFIERVMKEDNIQKTFEKRVFLDLQSLVRTARETVVAHLPTFESLHLPDFQYELVRLIGFPGRLIVEVLKVRLDAAAKLVDPNPIVINDMIENFRQGIMLAVEMKRQYEEIVAPDPEGRWRIPPCLAPEYDAVLLGGIRTFFKLLHWKLKAGTKGSYFSETELLEDEWEFLYDTAEAVEGGDLVVAEQFCSLTNKLMVRVCNYFDSQLQVPVPHGTTPTADKKVMTSEEMLIWYGKILDAVKMRYRKLQRFARRLTQRFDNSAEYALEDGDLHQVIQQLQESGHFLVYTQVYEERGTYIIADGSLWDQPHLVRRLLQRAFSANVGNSSRPGNDPNSGDELDDEEAAGYLLLVSPRQNFAWTGAVMTLGLQYIEMALEDNRLRLVADGPNVRLSLCKQAFSETLDFELDCLVTQQAHLPRVQKELRKIARSAYRLSESFIESAAHVKHVLEAAPGTQDMIENWFLFASDHGKRVGGQVDYASHGRFTRLLMRLGISWVSFISSKCDPTDRKTFRWTVQALDYALKVTNGSNILQLDGAEFALLRKSVASLVSLLISHFDILGARSSVEAKKEAEKLAAMRRLQRLQENIDDEFIPQTPSAPGPGQTPVDRSIRLVREERLRLITELEQQRDGLSNDQHLVGQVLDEQVSEDRALVFLAASSSNIALRWQQGAFIGGGANGNVYIGFNIDSGGIMAVKEIRVQEVNSGPALYKQIQDESDVMSMLQHPNIVEYYGIEVHRDRVYIFEEYCEGGSLANLLVHGRVEEEDIVKAYAIQILDGLQYLHSKGVEHRDIKPDNILLASGGSVLKLVDFGAAKAVAKGNRTLARTRAARQSRPAAAGGMNSVAGTPMYMAPEVIRSERPGRLGSSDIWSLGCVILEIATGRKPWNNLDNEWAIMFHIGIATQHPPLPDPDQLSELGIDFIEQCLTLNPPERPTASELLQHPWLADMERERHLYDADWSSPSIPSTTSTLVNPTIYEDDGSLQPDKSSESGLHN